MTPAFSASPQAAFRGQRDYYHSTDLYTALVDLLVDHGVEATSLDLKLRERIVTLPRMEAWDGELPTGAADAEALARVTAADGRLWHVTVRGGNQPISERKDYDETGIWTRTARDGSAFVASGCASVQPIEVVTAVGVLAHRTLFPPPVGQRWMLAQLQTDRLLGPAELDWFRFEVRRQLGRGTTQSVLADRKGPFGRMLFILK